MTTGIIITSTVYGVMALVTIFVMYRDRQPQYSVLKTATSIGFLIIAFLSWRETGSSLYIALLPGYVLCLIGDIVLSVAGEIDNNLKRIPFTLGVGAFLLAHVFYCYRFLELADFNITWPAGIAVLTFIYTVYSTGSDRFDYGSNKIPSMIYSVFVGLFGGLGASLILVNGVSVAMIMAGVGAVLFMISDAVLANRYFQKRPHPSLGFVSLFTYYAAMWLMCTFPMFI